VIKITITDPNEVGTLIRKVQNYAGCDSVVKIVKSLVTSIQTTPAIEFTVFPNPTSDFVTLDFGIPLKNSATMIVTDILGREMLRQSLPSGTERRDISLKELGSNLFFIHIQTAKNVWTVKKVVVLN
jgi:hypothetical protein